ncbi:hypothetical protein D3273_07285 [Lichenibacterium minor]|uniref:DUF805 domain-containing protein n=1 Tax=Lichenibacterium minor TaxID=2316528 RepID=A0A4Q2U771_9HYPH|nr:hypothetical protein [Lichenibacterium minor]RYC32539.1 hypothetical protein D3273_07285 [Lichenibacterium minor]
MADAGFRFLYREDRGRIDRALWWRATLPLAALVALATAGWVAVRPYAAHDLNRQPFIDGATVGAYLYLAAYAFGLILAAVCSYNVSAKRFRDRGRAGRWAAGLPLACFLTGALVWFIPQSFGDVPDWAGRVAEVALLVVVAWNVLDLGVGPTDVRNRRVLP